MASREAIRQERADRRAASAANGGTYPGPITHGGRSYTNYGCRCGSCRSAHNANIRADRVRRYAETATNDDLAPAPTHNAATYANWGCRCDQCLTGRAAYDRPRRRRSGQRRKATA